MSSTDPLSPIQSEAHPKYIVTPINEEHYYISRTSRSPSTISTPLDLARSVDPVTRKREGKWGHQDLYNSETPHSVNTDNNHNTCNTDNKDPRPAKRRKPHAVPAATPIIYYRYTSKLPPRQPRPLVALSTARPEIDNVQFQANNGYSLTFVNKSHRYASRTSRSPSTIVETVPVTEYQEWPF